MLTTRLHVEEGNEPRGAPVGAKSRWPPVAEISSDLRSSEKEQTPQCGVSTIEDADIRHQAKTR